MTGKRAILVLLLGCRPTFETLDDACHDVVPGFGNAPQAWDFAWRANCHRRVARMARGRLDARVQEAVASHVAWLDRHVDPDAPPEGFDQTRQTPGTAGFTGGDLLERLRAAQYQVGNIGETFFWEAYDQGVGWDDAAIYVDWMMAYPHYRQVVLQPGWQAAGFARSPAGWVEAVVISPFPSDAHAQRPVLYPADGQIDVPVAANWPVWVDGEVEGLWIGYPITLTVGGRQAAGALGSNPYGIEVVDLRLEGPSGPLPFEMMLPGRDVALLHSTVAILPREPFASSTTYTATFEVLWSDRARSTTYETTFRTGDGNVPPERPW